MDMNPETRANLKVAYLNVGNAEMEAGRHERAIAALRQALELDPDYSLAHFALGVTYQAQARAAQNGAQSDLLALALTHLVRAITARPGLIQAYHLLATVLKDLGREDERIQWLEQAAEQSAANLQTWRNLGAAYRAQARWSEACTAYEKALTLAPDDVEVLRALARVCYRFKDWERAAAYFARVLAAGEGTAEDYSRLGGTRYYLKQPVAALEAVEQAVKLAPQNAVYQYNLGLLLAELGRHAEAEAAFRRAIELNPDYAAAWNNLGALYQSLQRHEEAETAYRRVIEFDPDDAQGYGNLGWLYYRQGRLEKAIAETERALSLAPDAPVLPYNLALFHLLAGRTDRALDLYASALAPDADRSGLGEAINDLQQALEENPALTPAHLALGLLYQAQGNTSAASAAYRQLLSSTTDPSLRRQAQEHLSTLSQTPTPPST
jgi:superkiller protein 3